MATGTDAISRLTKLKRSRAPRRLHLNKLLTELAAAVEDESVAQVEEGLAKLVMKESELYAVDAELEDLFPEGEAEQEILETAELVDKIVVAKVRANRLLAKNETASATFSGVGRQAAGRVRAKLPKLQIAKFEGQFADWHRFSEQFEASIDSNNGLSDMDKFSYLRSLLATSVLSTIQGLALTGANYVTALQLLKSKYGKPTVLKNEYIQAILQIQPVKASEDVVDFRRFVEEMQVNLRSLQTLGVDYASLGVIICPIIFQALPAYALREWNRRYQANKDEDLPLLLTFLTEEVEGIERVWRARQGRNNQREGVKDFKAAGSQAKAKKNSDWSPASASALLASSEKSPTKSKRTCVFCGSTQHSSTKCQNVASYEARQGALRTAKRCFSCFSADHFAKECDRKMRCLECQGPHNVALCRQVLEKMSRKTENSPGRQSNAQQSWKGNNEGGQPVITSTASTSPESGSKRVVALQTLSLWIQENGRRQKIVALLDGGSERSFVRKSLVDDLRLNVSQYKDLNIKSFGGNSQQQRCREVEIPLVLKGGIQTIQALEVQEICHGVKYWEEEVINRLLKKPKNVDWCNFVAQGRPEKIDLLIGSDFYWSIVTGHMKRIGNSLMALQTPFGWTVQGLIETSSQQSYTAAIFLHAAIQQEMDQEESANDLMQRLWEVEQLEAGYPEKEITQKEADVLEGFEERIQFRNGRYSVGIPWNVHKKELCVNYGMARNRLQKILLRLKKDEGLFTRYSEGMRNYFDMDHAEKVVSAATAQSPLYYMPHQPVIKEQRETSKLRIVFDASAKAKGHFSLNDCQEVGPNLNPTIFNVLLQFRQHRIGITSDVEKAFLQIELNEEDRDATRFLWIEEQQLGPRPPIIVTYRMKRVLFGMKSSPFLLAATIRYHAKKFCDSHPSVWKVIDQCTYVDDHVVGADSTEEGYQLYKNTQHVLQQGGMILKKWTSNDGLLTKKWIEEKILADDDVKEETNVLGLKWNTRSDELFFKNTFTLSMLEANSTTKRAMLKIAAQLFDPLGVLGPVVFEAKHLLQEAWRKKVGWDEEVDATLSNRWKRWRNSLVEIGKLRIPRWTKISNQILQEVHVFCDASQKGYGAVAYIRVQEAGSTQFHTQLVAAKSRIAPIQLVSLPRLELLACLLGAELGNHIQAAWEKNARLKFWFWSDSKVALQWLSENPSRWKLFIAQRVTKIQEFTKTNQWRHCKGVDNPADILSRGCRLKELLSHGCWWRGPKWLGTDFAVEERSCQGDQETTKEMEREAIEVLYVQEGIDVLNVERFSSWRKLSRVVAWMRRFIVNCKRQEEARFKDYLQTKEIKQAEETLFLTHQGQVFGKEVESLRLRKEVDKSSKLRQFTPFLDEKGIIRLRGRLKLSHLAFNQKHPVMMGTGLLTTLFILDKHRKLMHGGVQEVLVKVREQVWVLGARREARRAIRQCMVCRRWKATPGMESAAQLPKERISRGKPFSVVGIDFFGPIWVKKNGDFQKMYGCIFTCAVVRAVHLELTQSQETESFLMAFRRFLARRGECEVVWSDNAQTFHQSDRMLRNLFEGLKGKKVQDFASEHGITWKFITPRAAWWGGFYERMIGTVKQHLRKTLGQARLSEEELRTILAETEAVVNARPLTYVSEESTELDYLTPGLLLLQKRGTGLAGYNQTIPEFPRKAFVKRWRYQCRLVDGFWRRWSREYLLMLRTAHKNKVSRGNHEVTQGDIVVMIQERVPRNQWRLAKVLETTAGRDGKIRSVILKTTSGEQVRRAIQQVCPLEIAEEKTSD